MNMLSALPIILTILQLGTIVASLWVGGRLLRSIEALLPSGRTRTRLSHAFIRLIVWIATSMMLILPFLDLLGLVRDLVEIFVSRPVITPQIDTFLFSLILLAMVYGSVLLITQKNLLISPKSIPLNVSYLCSCCEPGVQEYFHDRQSVLLLTIPAIRPTKRLWHCWFCDGCFHWAPYLHSHLVWFELCHLQPNY